MLTDNEIRAMAALGGERCGENYIRRAEASGSGFILAWDGGALTGFLEYSGSGSVCNVKRVITDSSRRMDALKSLAAAAYPVIKEQSYDRYTSAVSRTSLLEIIFYKKLGFRTADEDGSDFIMSIERSRLLGITEKYAIEGRKG